MKKWLIIGLIIRLLIIPLTFHSDTQLFILSNYLLVAKSLWLGFYDYLGSTSEPLALSTSPDAFTYPPLAILTQGIFASLFYRLIDLDFVKQFILNPVEVIHELPLLSIWLLFLTKLPYILADLSLGYLLAKLVAIQDRKRNSDPGSVAVFKLWMLNPVTLYATFAIGQFDIYPTLATVLAVWLVIKSVGAIHELPLRHYAAALCLGIGGAFKLFPLLFLPLLIIKVGKNFQEKLLLAVVGCLGYLIPILPYLGSPGFRHYALLAPQTDKFLFAKIPVSGAEYLSIFIVGYVLIIAFSWFRKIELWQSFASVLLLFFAVTHFHPQWFLWLSPWLVLMYSSYPITKLPITVLLFCYFLVILSFESSLNWGIFIWNQNVSSLISFLPQAIQLEKFKYLSIIRSLFAGSAIYLIYLSMNSSHKKYES